MRDIILIIKENERRYLNPLGLERRAFVRWATGMNLTRSDIVFYTGGLYQMVPYIEKFANMMEKISGISSRATGVARLLSRVKSLASLVPVKSTERYDRIKGIYSQFSGGEWILGIFGRMTFIQELFTMI